MRITGAVVCAVAVATLSGCTDDSDGETPQPRAVTAAESPTPRAAATTPSPEATYIAAPGDPKAHTFNVTIRDQISVPYSDAYKIVGDRCISQAIPDFPNELVFEGPDKDYERRPLKSFPIPEQARLANSKTCEATMTVTLPYAPRYFIGVAMEGHGMPGPHDPGETEVQTKGGSQDIVVLR